MAINCLHPATSEIEISLFGPGTGECVVVHLGGNDWMVVDSCLGSNKEPVALSYLDAINVPYDCVKVIVVSHFHDDHIKGMNELVARCSQAQVYISSALVAEESIAFAHAYARPDSISDRNKSSTHELCTLLEIADKSSRQVKWAGESSVIYNKHGVRVSALSPSQAAVSQSRLDFAKEFEAAGIEYRRLAKRLSPNLCAVALHICNGVDTVLLGSDLEVSNSDSLGWEAVVSSSVRPNTAAAVFKVPHHGSHNGHYQPVIQDMLKANPVSIITTMNTHHLPLPRDIERIKSYSGSVYHTTQPRIRPPKRDRAVDEVMAFVSKNRSVVPRVVGHIQLRMSNGVISVCLNEHASHAA